MRLSGSFEIWMNEKPGSLLGFFCVWRDWPEGFVGALRWGLCWYVRLA